MSLFSLLLAEEEVAEAVEVDERVESWMRKWRKQISEAMVGCVYVCECAESELAVKREKEVDDCARYTPS